MLTAGTDGTTRLFDVAARAPLGMPFPGLDNLGVDAEFSSDGTRAVSVYERGNGFVYDLQPDGWKARACAIAARTMTRDEWSSSCRAGHTVRRVLPKRRKATRCSASGFRAARGHPGEAHPARRAQAPGLECHGLPCLAETLLAPAVGEAENDERGIF